MKQKQNDETETSKGGGSTDPIDLPPFMDPPLEKYSATRQIRAINFIKTQI